VAISKEMVDVIARVAALEEVRKLDNDFYAEVIEDFLDDITMLEDRLADMEEGYFDTEDIQAKLDDVGNAVKDTVVGVKAKGAKLFNRLRG
jgi:peptidoglycan hydrolase CwlO-like protein